MNDSPTVTDQFTVSWKDQQYGCKRLLMGESIIFVIAFTQRPLYLSNGVDVKGERFWVSIPHDTKLTHIVFDLGKQIDEHYNRIEQ